MDLVYTIEEASKALKVDEHIIYNEIKNGNLKAVKIGSMRIRGKDLREYLNKLPLVYPNKN